VITDAERGPTRGPPRRGGAPPAAVLAPYTPPVRALVVLHGEIDTDHLRRELANAGWVVAADGGTAAVLAAGGRCDVIVGDQDSVSAEALARARAANPAIDVRVYPTAKDFTDAEIALRAALERHPGEVVVAGAFGGDRLDHELGTIALLAHREWADTDVILRDARRSVALVRRCRAWTGSVGDLVTLLAWGGDAAGVSTRGLQYPLSGARLPLGASLGVSNVMVEASAALEVEAGAVLVIHVRQDVSAT